MILLIIAAIVICFTAPLWIFGFILKRLGPVLCIPLFVYVMVSSGMDMTKWMHWHVLIAFAGIWIVFFWPVDHPELHWPLVGLASLVFGISFYYLYGFRLNQPWAWWIFCNICAIGYFVCCLSYPVDPKAQKRAQRRRQTQEVVYVEDLDEDGDLLEDEPTPRELIPAAPVVDTRAWQNDLARRGWREREEEPQSMRL